MKVVIIGGGPAGLFAGWHLKQRGYNDFVILEKESRVGGLAASWVPKLGWKCDYGGHIVYSGSKRFNVILDDLVPFNRFDDRSAFVYFKERMVPYPFQLNLEHLPGESRAQCLKGLARRPRLARKDNLEVWLRDVFGEELAEMFFIPYNKKVWASNPDELSVNWFEDRIALVDKNQLNIGNKWGPNRSFSYPSKGGMSSIWDAMAKRLGDAVVLNNSAVEVDWQRNCVMTWENNFSFDRLISTIPLDQLVTILKPKAPEEVVRAAFHLKKSKLIVTAVGIRGKAPDRDLHWMYFPEERFPFFRVTLLSGYSRDMAPVGHFLLLAETSVPADSKEGVSKSNVIEALLETPLGGHVSDTDVVMCEQRTTDYGYPLPALDRDQNLNAIFGWLKKTKISTIGRFGSWAYERGNMDHAEEMAWEIVNSGIDIPAMPGI